MAEIATNNVAKLLIVLVVFVIVVIVYLEYTKPDPMEKAINNVDSYESSFVREITCAEFTKNCGINSENSNACTETLKKLKGKYFMQADPVKEHKNAMNEARAICTKYTTLVDVYLIDGVCGENAKTALNTISTGTKKQQIQYAGLPYVSFQAKQNTPYCVVAVEKNHCFQVNLTRGIPKVICGIDKVPISFIDASSVSGDGHSGKGEGYVCSVTSSTLPNICYYYYEETCGATTGRLCEIKVIFPLFFNNNLCGGK